VFEHSFPQEGAEVASPDWRPLYLFNLYRLTVALVFTGTVAAQVAPSFLGEFDRPLFLITGWSYLGIAILSILVVQRRWIPFQIQVIVQILLDIALTTLLMHASGGVNSGLGVLLVIVVAGGSLLTEGRTAFFFAATASLSVLIHITLADIDGWFPFTSYTHGGMLGTTFFATAYLSYTLARRVRVNEALAKQRGIHLYYLAQLNAQIVQNIQSGIIVIDQLGFIRLFNQASQQLLGLTEQPNGLLLVAVCPELVEQMTFWQKHGKLDSPVFRPRTGEFDLIPTFTELNNGEVISILIVLEDAALMTQRAQQLKLASLGRLTASIAHEIRNPLAAISHAGQLLAESPQILETEQYLLQIIERHSQRVNAIIESVLQLSRREEPHFQRFDLQKWLNTFKEEFTTRYELTHDKIVIQPRHPSLPPSTNAYTKEGKENATPHYTITFDAIQLYQVLCNLCENGLRYSQGTPLIELTIYHEFAKCYLDIRDHGHGIDTEIAAQVFEPFFTTEIKGTGLGLYIAREICEANRASLKLIQNDATGCCFRIHFAKLEN